MPDSVILHSEFIPTIYTMKKLILPKQIELAVEDIMYLKSDSNYTHIFRKSQRNDLLVALSLCKLQASLDQTGFVRINRSNLINLSYIRKYIVEKETVQVILKNGKKIRSSRRRTESILIKLKENALI